MIPRRLQLKNFLSYGSAVQTLDFGNHRLICLSGKNGHGKSALLDAITWVLWGQARKVGATSKADQGLLRLGEVEMMVCFDFAFGNHTYRVRRDFSQKYGKPHTHLEFGMLDADEHFISLTDKTLRATQEKIEKTLGLDFDTFINSSFLRQGGSNEFSKKSAKERKEILSTILGLHTYDKARATVLEESKECAAQKLHTEKLKELCAQEYAHLATVPQEIADVTSALALLAHQETSCTQEREHLLKKKTELASQQETSKLLAASLEHHHAQEMTQKVHLQELVQQWKTTHRALLAATDQQAVQKEYETVARTVQQLQDTLQKQIALKETVLNKKEKVTALKTALETEHHKQIHAQQLNLERVTTTLTTLTTQLSHIHTQQESARATYTKAVHAVAEQRKNLPADILLSEKQDIVKQFEQRKALYQQWISQGNSVNAELKQIAQKQMLSQDSANPCCPLCEQNLSQSRKRFLHKKFTDHSQQLTHRFNRIKKGLETLKGALHTQHTHLQTVDLLETLVRQESQLKELLDTLTAQYQELLHQETTARKEQDAVKQTVAQLLSHSQKILENDHAYQAAHKELTETETALLACAYNPEHHKQAVARLEQLTAHKELFAQSFAQKTVQKERQQTIHSMCVGLKQLRKTQVALTTQLQPYQTLSTQYAQLVTQEAEIAARHNAYLTEKELLLQKKGQLETLSTQRVTLEKQEKEHTAALQTLTTQMYDLQIIAQAFGKDGIQALLIEDAIPEIEQEANTLLARLTDNQASITIESLRDLKKGGARETLDINISDATGIRPYEMFSGGEAFRIDFALRIAISKLLARRAGTSLQTLIIDEGFGSQDEDGLQRMMDALYAIQEDFEKILIVSHLPSMKEQFPVHFHIHKDPQGSRVTVIEQG